MKRKIKGMTSALFVTLSLALIVCIGCKKKSDDSSTPASQGSNDVWIQNTAFNPSTITVAVNTTVKWTNKDHINHTATSNTGLFNSGTMSNSETYSFQFTTVGTFAYHCSIHSGMTGTVVVQ